MGDMSTQHTNLWPCTLSSCPARAGTASPCSLEPLALDMALLLLMPVCRLPKWLLSTGDSAAMARMCTVASVCLCCGCWAQSCPELSWPSAGLGIVGGPSQA